MDVHVIGGGISGLAAAWELSHDPTLTITVFESDDRVGGKIQASPFAGTMLDEGADAFLRRVPDAVRLCSELGLTELTSPRSLSAKVWSDGRLRMLPAGLVLGVPVDFEALAASEILTPWGLARARCEEDETHEAVVGDCSIGELITNRYGREVTDRLVGPLLGGIAAGSIDEMSLDAVTPQLATAAHRAGSMTVALRDMASTSAAEAGPVFARPSGTMSTLVTTLASALEQRGVAINTGTEVSTPAPSTPTVITTPARVTAELLDARSPRSAAFLRNIDVASVVFTALAFDPADVPIPLDASGFLVPRDAGLSVTAVSWSSAKWEQLSHGPVIVRASLGHAGDDGSIDLSDDEVLARIRADLLTTMGISAVPLEYRITRYRDAFPQYAVGHLDRIDELEATLAVDAPNLVVCGMAHRGVGIPACIREARRAARILRERFPD